MSKPELDRDVDIYDVTLRDGNQALAKPWNFEQKRIIFELLANGLKVPAIEVGFPGSSAMDFKNVADLAALAPAKIIVGALSRCMETDIRCAAHALNFTKLGAIPRIHVFIGMSPFHMAEVLKSKPEEVRALAVDMVQRAAELMKPMGGQVQFSPEHFGDCLENLPWLIGTLQEIVWAGAEIINLPNTVERTSPEIFSGMVSQVVKELPGIWLGKQIKAAVHCHNDLGMATATSLASYQSGFVSQIEVALNGLGERAGNANLQEVAIALENLHIRTNLNLTNLYEASLITAELSQTQIPWKAPLIGRDVFKHRSGIHQHGASLTEDKTKGAYRPIDPKIIGRVGAEECEFTSQSGVAGIKQILSEAGIIILEDHARMLQPALKEASEQFGMLSQGELVSVYERFIRLFDRIKQPTSVDLRVLASDAIKSMRNTGRVQLIKAVALAGIDKPIAQVTLAINGEEKTEVALGDGPVSAVINAIIKLEGSLTLNVLNIGNIGDGAEGQGIVRVALAKGKKSGSGEAIDTDIIVATAKACVEALNDLLE